MSETEADNQDSTSLPPETRAANRSANIGCLLIVIALCVILFSFGLGGYSTFRLNQYREDLILQNLETTLIPKVEFTNLPAPLAMEELKKLAAQANPWFKGVQFKCYNETDLKDPRARDSLSFQNPLSVKLVNIPALEVLTFFKTNTGGTVEIIDGSVNLLPKNETLEPRKLLSLKQVSPDFWKSSPLVKTESPSEFWDVKPLLISEGLPFLPRTYAWYYPAQKRLEISNLKANNEKISTWLQEKQLVPKP